MSDIARWSVLVVEDEPDGQEVVAGILGHFNIQTDVAATGEDALTFLAENHYDAAIIDLALPGINGIELLRAIRRNPETMRLPCIAVTAYHSAMVKKQALEAGCNAFVAKPLDDRYFVSELERVINE
jgi:CheY-like chemotaxis protein